MPLYWDRKLLLAKKETTYGTDATPAAADALEAFDVELGDLVPTYVDRRPATPWFRAPEPVFVFGHQSLGFYVEAAGAGAAGTAPQYADLLKACGLAETITAATRVEYAPANPAYDAASVYGHFDAERSRLLGARGNAVFEFEAGQIPRIRLAMMGLYTVRAAQAFPTPDWTGWTAGLPVNKTNTPTFTLHGQSCRLRRATFDLGQRAVYRNLAGAGVEEIDLTGRSPSGACTVEMPTAAVKDFIASARGGTGALQLVHGTAAGAIVQVDCPAAVITNPRRVEQDGVTLLELSLALLPTSAGNDEIKFTVK